MIMKVTFNPTKIYQNRLPFKGTTTNLYPDNGDDKNRNEEDAQKPLPNWARKTMLFVVVFFAFKNDPTVQRLLPSGEPSQEELDKTEFVNSVQKMRKEKGVSSSFYHLNRLMDVDRPKITKLGKDYYNAKVALDDETLDIKMHLDSTNKDTIYGEFQSEGSKKALKYKAIFSKEDKDEFKVLIKDGDKAHVLGRDFDGELYILKGKQKVPLNNKNTEKYQEYLDMLDMRDDLEFFTDSNSLWRKLNYLLLIFLLYNEMKYDNQRRKNNKNDN